MNKILIKYWKPIFYFVIVLVIVISSISVLWLPPETKSAPVFLVFMPFIAYAVMVLMSIIYKKLDGESFVWGKKFYQGASLGLALMAMIFLIELASGLISIKKMSPGFEDILIGGVILQGIVVVGEELPFRGYIVPDLAKKYGM
jgi:membrane protease YdiL (CAAX protease family)